jgi:glycosyltransferase involved in cell wall biosynthesis
MRILLVANINSPHTSKWALALKQRGHAVALFSIDPLKMQQKWISQLDQIYAPKSNSKNLIIKYREALKSLNAIIHDFKPELLHAHYLTNYGLLAAASRFHPLVCTAWGSDVYEFPKQNSLNKFLLKWLFSKSDRLISTSLTMKKEMALYTKKEISVIPFGVNFSLYKTTNSVVKVPETLNIACFKRFGEVYGQDILLKAFAEARIKTKGIPLKLHFYGDGKMEDTLKVMVELLDLKEHVQFHGWISQTEIIEALHQTQLCVYFSRRESFGVSLVEAMAARVPLLVSKIEAFEEVGKDGVYYALPNDQASANAALINAHNERENWSTLTELAYEQAFKRFDLINNIQEQEKFYQDLLKTRKLD